MQIHQKDLPSMPKGIEETFPFSFQLIPDRAVDPQNMRRDGYRAKVLRAQERKKSISEGRLGERRPAQTAAFWGLASLRREERFAMGVHKIHTRRAYGGHSGASPSSVMPMRSTPKSEPMTAPKAGSAI